MNSTSFNVARHLQQQASAHPSRIATISADGQQMTFAQLQSECDRFVRKFLKAGMTNNMRVATFVRPGLSFVPAIFAMFKIGAVPVFIDPGMPLKNMLKCLQEVKPQAMVGVPLAHMLASIFRTSFHSASIRICIGRWISAFNVEPARPVKAVSSKELVEASEKGENELAAILFTSGSTGIPKGVECSHGLFDSQQRMLRATYDVEDDEVDLVVFPLFALFSAAWGVTAVIGDLDPAKPAKASGERMAQMITQYGVTHSAGSPAIWQNLAEYCLATNKTLPTMRRILTAGAPVPPSLIAQLSDLLPNGHVHTPYGATEALPLTSIDDRELLGDCLTKTRSGFGTCVGRVLPEIDVKIIAISDEVIETIKDAKELRHGSLGEICVSGPIVTRSYFGRMGATRLAKIRDGERIWHRMGDVGYFDQQGRLWFCGRKDHRVRTQGGDVFPVRCEGVFNKDPRVRRSALVGIGENGKQRPVLVVQRHKTGKRTERNALVLDLLSMAQQNPETATVQSVIFKDDFPVDVRHNIKINRPLLAKFANRRLRK